MAKLLPRGSPLVAVVLALCCLLTTTGASLGDRLPEFRECVQVRDAEMVAPQALPALPCPLTRPGGSNQICLRENCDTQRNPTHIRERRRAPSPLPDEPSLRRLLPG